MAARLFVVFLLLGSLVALTGLRQFFVAPLDDRTMNTVWFVVQVLPLLVALPGVMRGHLRSTFLLCLFSLLYFVHGVLAAFDPQLRIFGWLEIATSLGLCTLTALMVRKMREVGAEGQ